MADDGRFDVVIVGAGPAGCVLARRLTEDPRADGRPPGGGPRLRSRPARLAGGDARPDVVCDRLAPLGLPPCRPPADRPLPLPRARVVGGTSTINACVWMRGSAADYDGWAAAGNPGWAFADLLPYFRRAEADPLGGPLHGTDGPVPVFRVTEADLSPVDRAFVAAAESLGFPCVADLNGDPVQRPGVGPTPKNVAGWHADARGLHLPRPGPLPARTSPSSPTRSSTGSASRTAGRRACAPPTGGRCGGGRSSSAPGPTAHRRSCSAPASGRRRTCGRWASPSSPTGRASARICSTTRPSSSPTGTITPPTGSTRRTRRPRVTGDPDAAQGAQRPGGRRRSTSTSSTASSATRQRSDVGRLVRARSGGRSLAGSGAPDLTRSSGDARHRSRLPRPIRPSWRPCCDGMELIRRLVATRPLADAIDPMPGQVPDMA